MVKKAEKRALQDLKTAKYMQTDDDDVNIDDVATVGYNSDTEMNLADKRTPPTSVAQQQAKRTIKKYKNVKRKAGKINQKIR